MGHKHVPESELIQFRVSRELAAGLTAAALEQEVSRRLMNLVERFLRVEEEKQRENEARNPDPTRRYEDDRVGELGLYESMVGMHERKALSPARMKELFLDIGTKSAAAAQEFLTYGEQIPDEEVSSNGTVEANAG